MNDLKIEEIARNQTETMTIEQLKQFATIGLIVSYLVAKKIMPEVK